MVIGVYLIPRSMISKWSRQTQAVVIPLMHHRLFHALFTAVMQSEQCFLPLLFNLSTSFPSMWHSTPCNSHRHWQQCQRFIQQWHVVQPWSVEGNEKEKPVMHLCAVRLGYGPICCDGLQWCCGLEAWGPLHHLPCKHMRLKRSSDITSDCLCLGWRCIDGVIYDLHFILVTVS